VKVLAIVHQPDAGLGVFAEAIEASRARVQEWCPAERPDPPAAGEHDAVIALGGAMHPDQEPEHPWVEDERRLLGRLVGGGVPVLGVCLGAQLLAQAAGGAVRRAPEPEIGWCRVETTPEGAGDPLLGPLAPAFEALEWHSFEFSLPPGAVALAASDRCLQAFRTGARGWGIQFHAEVAERDLEHWIDDYRSDPDAVASGLDPDALRAQGRERIAGWNEVGRELCERFLADARRAQ
jgi:GMP synthase (glutamine-hydrolysing)